MPPVATWVHHKCLLIKQIQRSPLPAHQGFRRQFKVGGRFRERRTISKGRKRKNILNSATLKFSNNLQPSSRDAYSGVVGAKNLLI